MRLVVAARFGLIAWLGIGIFPTAQIAAPVKLNGSLTLGGNVEPSFRFSDDGSRVLYVADQDTASVFELYSVSTAGGALQKINGPLVNGGDVAGGGQFSPDGNRVLYVADQETLETFEL